MKASVKKLIISELNKALNEGLDKVGTPLAVIEYAKRKILNVDHYGWFERPKSKKEKKTEIYCAACQSTYIGFKPKHNTYDYCPKCKQQILMRRMFFSRNYRLTNKDYVCYFQKFGDVIIARFFDNCRFYSDEKFKLTPEGNLAEYQRIIFRKGSTKNYINFRSWYDNSKNWSLADKVNPHVYNYHILNSKDALKELFASTHLECSAWFDYSTTKGMNIISLYKFATWPVLEYLMKLNYYTLVQEIIDGRTREDKSLNLYAKKANAVLGVPHSILQKFDHENLRERDIKAIKQLIDYGRLGQLTLERIKFISSILTSRSLDPLGIFRDFGIEKVINYINKLAAIKDKEKQEKYQKDLEESMKADNACSRYYNTPTYYPVTPQTVWRDFQDYRCECHELGYDITNEGVMFPKDLYAAHSRTSGLISKQRAAIAAERYAIENETTIKAFSQAVKKYIDQVISDNRYIFRICKEPQELLYESERLNHCVGTRDYDKRVAKGSCLIFFIRAASDPDKPLYTLELATKSNNIVQLRGFSNREAPPDVYDFAKKCLQKLETKASA